MRQRINTRFANCLLAIGLSALAPVAAQAQAANDKWQWELGIYGWFPAIGGTTAFPSGGSGPSFDVSASDVIDSLKMTFMGQAEARKGQWGVWTDIVYADLGGSKSSTRDFTDRRRAGGCQRQPELGREVDGVDAGGSCTT